MRGAYLMLGERVIESNMANTYSRADLAAASDWILLALSRA